MQSPLQHDLPLRGLRSDSACAGYLRVAGVALLGAGVIAVTPIASGLPDFRHAGVTLTMRRSRLVDSPLQCAKQLGDPAG